MIAGRCRGGTMNKGTGWRGDVGKGGWISVEITSGVGGGPK